MRTGFANASAISDARSLSVTRNTVEHNHDRSPRGPHAWVSGLAWRCTDAATGNSARRDMSARSYRRPGTRSGPDQTGSGSAFRMASSTRWLTTLLDPPGGIETPYSTSPASIVRFWCVTITS